MKGQGAWQGGEGERDTRGEKDEVREGERERERERDSSWRQLKACAKRGRDRGERSSVGEVIDTGHGVEEESEGNMEIGWREREKDIGSER